MVESEGPHEDRQRRAAPDRGVHRAVLQALEYARSLSGDVRAVYVDVDAQVTDSVRRHCEKWAILLDSRLRRGRGSGQSQCHS